MITNRRWLAYGAGLSVLGIVLGVVIAGQFPHGYSGGTIRVRGWLVMLSAAVAVPSALGMLCFAKAAPPVIRWVFAASGVLWGVHLALLGALVDRPLAAEAGWVTLLEVLVFAPALLRALGMLTSHYGKLALPDLVIVAWVWSATPVEVLARAHPGQATWWMPIPCALALVAMAAYSDP